MTISKKTLLSIIISLLLLLLLLSLPTRTIATSPTPSPTPSSTPNPIEVELTEIMACPETGENEWIELKNTTSQTAFITDWKVRDNNDNTKTISAEIPTDTHQIVDWSGSLLNNAGDELHLETDQGEVLLSVDLPTCTKGSSFVFSDNLWQETTSPSPNQENPPLPSNQQQTATQAAQVSLAHTPQQNSQDEIEHDLVSPSSLNPTDLSVARNPNPISTATPTPIDYKIPNVTLENIEEVNPFHGQRIEYQSSQPSKTGFTSLVLGGVLLVVIGFWGVRKLLLESGVFKENFD